MAEWRPDYFQRGRFEDADDLRDFLRGPRLPKSILCYTSTACPDGQVFIANPGELGGIFGALDLGQPFVVRPEGMPDFIVLAMVLVEAWKLDAPPWLQAYRDVEHLVHGGPK